MLSHINVQSIALDVTPPLTLTLTLTLTLALTLSLTVALPVSHIFHHELILTLTVTLTLTLTLFVPGSLTLVVTLTSISGAACADRDSSRRQDIHARDSVQGTLMSMVGPPRHDRTYPHEHGRPTPGDM